jgi:hypothetical protein
MDLVPPWSFAKRQEWARAHPWVVACYFATLTSVFTGFVLPVLMGSPASVRFKVLVGLVTWPVTAMLLVVGLKRRWGERPDAEASPPPSARRIWSRASDRFLLWWMWFGVAATVVSALELVTGADRSWAPALAVAFGSWWVTTTWGERRRRRSETRGR